MRSHAPRPSDRYEPLPSIAELPPWLWRKAGLGVRIALGVALLVAVGLAVVLVPDIQESEQERAAAEQRESADRRARLAAALEAEMRPRLGRAAPATTLADRAGTMGELRAAILADARARVRRGGLDGPIRRLRCEPFPRSLATNTGMSSRRPGESDQMRP